MGDEHPGHEPGQEAAEHRERHERHVRHQSGEGREAVHVFECRPVPCEILTHVRGGLDGEVLRRLRDAGPQTKAELAAWLRVPRTTLQASLRELVAAGHLEDGPLAPSSGGRRSVSVRVAPSRVAVAVSIGERRVRVAVLDGQLTISAGVSIDLHDRGSAPDPISETVLRATQQLLGGRIPVAIGVESPTRGRGCSASSSAPWGRCTPARRSPRSQPCARWRFGERRSGAARHVDDFVAVRLGGSVTTATVAGGHLGTGATGRSGEIGHLRVEEFGPACVCGLTGCLDSFVSSVALVGQATELARRGRSAPLARVLDQSGALDLADLVSAGQAGDPAVVQLARELGQRLGRVVASLVAQANPRCIVLGGPVAALGGHLLGDLRATVYRLAPARLAEDLKIVLSELGEQAVLIGTGSEALETWIVNDSGATYDENGQK